MTDFRLEHLYQLSFRSNRVRKEWRRAFAGTRTSGCFFGFNFWFSIGIEKQGFIGEIRPFGHFNVCTSIVIVYLCVHN
jgi:hypothetical protein